MTVKMSSDNLDRDHCPKCGIAMTDLADYKQAASVEAGLRREFLARAEKAESEIERLRAALWPFAMKGLKGTTVCEDDFRRAKEAMPHAPDFEKPAR